MYLKRIVIKNIKCFEELELDFGDPKEIRLWTGLLGQNGLGKSTLLQAIAATLAGPDAMRELLPVAEGWVRRGSPYGTIEADLLWSDGDSAPGAGAPSETATLPISYLVTGDPDQLPENLRGEMYTSQNIVEWAGEGTESRRKRVRQTWKRLKHSAFAESKTGWFACGYGPFRRLSGGTRDAEIILHRERRSARFVTLFREDAALTNAAQWLIELHNTARDGSLASRNALERVQEVFITDFFPVRVELKLGANEALLVLPGQAPQRFEQLSDGYRAMLALGIDLLRWLIRSYPEANFPATYPGVVLIDELDAHLHPTWQREIGQWLRDKFPALQFIIATHSPFLAQMAGPCGNILLKAREGRVESDPESESVHTWRADQILTELFQLPNTYAPDVEKRLREFQDLYLRKSQGDLDPIEEEEFRQLREWQETLPAPLEDPEHRRLSDRLKRAVDAADVELQGVS